MVWVCSRSILICSESSTVLLHIMYKNEVLLDQNPTFLPSQLKLSLEKNILVTSLKQRQFLICHLVKLNHQIYFSKIPGPISSFDQKQEQRLIHANNRWNHTLRLIMESFFCLCLFNEVICVEIWSSQMIQLLSPTTTKQKIPAILFFSTQYYICEKQMVNVNLAPFHHLLFVLLVKFRVLYKE